MLPLLLLAVTYRVQYVGEMRKVMREGDLTNHIDLSTLRDRRHLYALGPLDGLTGEITVIDSQAYVSRVGKPTLRQLQGKAPFFVWSEVDRWQDVTLPRVHSMEELQTAVEQAARRAKVDMSKPFPFLITGMADSGTYHIVDRKPGTKVSHETHAKFQVPYPVKGQVTMLGFWSDRHQGVFMPHGTNIHVLVVHGQNSGHLDDVEFGHSVRLRLPK